jgi:hypothetical protein
MQTGKTGMPDRQFQEIVNDSGAGLLQKPAGRKPAV